MIVGALVILAAIAAGLGYLALWPTWVRPVVWTPGPNRGWTGPLARRNPSPAFTLLEIGRGPEDMVMGPDGLLYTGLLDGRIVRFDPDGRRCEDVAHTGGRPLGVFFDRGGDLVVADPLRGLLRVTRRGGVDLLTDHAEGTPIGFANGVDIDADGVVWFSDMCTHYPHDLHIDYWEGRASGRLLSYDPATGTTSVRATGLHYPNGVALGPDARYILVCEMLAPRIVRVWLQGPRAGEREVFADGFPAYLDNISYDGDGMFWAALVGSRQPGYERFARRPGVRRARARMRHASIPHPMPWYRSGRGYDGCVVGIDTGGTVRACFHDPAGRYGAVTSVHRYGDTLFVGSIAMPGAARISLADIDLSASPNGGEK